MVYDKPFKTFSEQVLILQNRGLKINNFYEAEQFLKKVNYYRFSAYALPFQNHKDFFNSKITFNHVINLYNMDKFLRGKIFDYLDSIEIQLRTFITYFLGQKYGAFGYTDKINFSINFNHAEWMDNLKKEKSRSSEIYICDFNNKYGNYANLPIWMATEVMSLGTLSRLFAGMKKHDQKELAYALELNAPILQNWIHHLTYIRNLSAHHSRVWNRQMAIIPVLPIDSKWKSLKPGWNRLFGSFSIMLYFSNKFILNLKIKDDIKQVYNDYSHLPVLIMSGMGFCDDYDKIWLWSE